MHTGFRKMKDYLLYYELKVTEHFKRLNVLKQNSKIMMKVTLNGIQLPHLSRLKSL